MVPAPRTGRRNTGPDLRRTAAHRGNRRCLAESTRAQIRQVVLLGAGLDARAFRMPELRDCIVFEVDHPSTQAYKRQRTQGLDPLCQRIEHCAMDFERDALGDVLQARGFEAAKPSAWIWEGVTMYLTEGRGERHAPSGRFAGYLRQSLAADLPASRLSAEAWAQRVSQLGARIIGEALHTRLNPAEMADLLRRSRFSVLSDDSAQEWAEGRWPERERRRVRQWERLAIARRT